MEFLTLGLGAPGDIVTWLLDGLLSSAAAPVGDVPLPDLIVRIRGDVTVIQVHED